MLHLEKTIGWLAQGAPQHNAAAGSPHWRSVSGGGIAMHLKRASILADWSIPHLPKTGTSRKIL
jgi:hypothetical protein